MKKLLLPFLLAVAFIAAAFAADTVTEQVTVDKVTRIWRVQIFADFGADPTVEILKERVRVISGEVVGREQLPTISRKLSAVESQSVTLQNGKTLTASEMQEAVILLAALWQAENDAPPAPPADTPPAP